MFVFGELDRMILPCCIRAPPFTCCCVLGTILCAAATACCFWSNCVGVEINWPKFCLRIGIELVWWCCCWPLVLILIGPCEIVLIVLGDPAIVARIICSFCCCAATDARAEATAALAACCCCSRVVVCMSCCWLIWLILIWCCSCCCCSLLSVERSCCAADSWLGLMFSTLVWSNTERFGKSKRKCENKHIQVDTEVVSFMPPHQGQQTCRHGGHGLKTRTGTDRKHGTARIETRHGTFWKHGLKHGRVTDWKTAVSRI